MCVLFTYMCDDQYEVKVGNIYSMWSRKVIRIFPIQIRREKFTMLEVLEVRRPDHRGVTEAISISTTRFLNVTSVDTTNFFLFFFLSVLISIFYVLFCSSYLPNPWMKCLVFLPFRLSWIFSVIFDLLVIFGCMITDQFRVVINSVVCQIVVFLF